MSDTESSIYSDSDDDSIHYLDDDTDSSVDNLNNAFIDDDSDSDDSVVIIDEFDIDEFDRDNLEQIERLDANQLYSEKENGRYYIGLCKYMRNPKIYLMANTVSVKIFFKFEFQRIFRYLNCYCSMMIPNAKVEIMQLQILEDQTYSVVLKTHWLRLIQRHWKKAYKKRSSIIKSLRSPGVLKYREINGCFPYGLNKIPSIWGLLRDYAK
jgi:hypothetical protein